jgi:hypothetical protein
MDQQRQDALLLLFTTECAVVAHSRPTLGIMKCLIAFCFLLVGAASSAESSAPASMSALPLEVRRALQDLCRGCTFADAGTPWNSTDVIFDDRPQRRLVSIEREGAEWRIGYEHGGRGLHTHTITFSTRPAVHVVSTSSCMPSEKCREW